MYLKRLELHGFKTFAARTTLDFESGVTAVVGPNGSGKSNLSDAVRWAMGEQNLRNVRCRHAEDLIFAGAGQAARAGARPPMNMAEVMMTFDNTSGWLPVDFHEVRIGRRIYRGGDAEYLLNGARVRLRDITDLLARASVSAGGHLVIGQGLIDTMLNLRPEERRGLVETLAGLRFYYSRRDDAEAKLRAAEANLRNVDAMIAEAAPHLAALQAQAAAYAQYHEVERELRALLLQHYAQAYAQACERRDRTTGELAVARAALDAAIAAVQSAEIALAATRERLRQCAGEAAALRGEGRAAHEARETAERNLAVSRARREAAAARLEDVRVGLPALEARRVEAAKELARSDETVRAVEAERATLHQARGPVEHAVEAATTEAAGAERALRALADRRRDLERQEAAATAELAAVEREEAAVRDEGRRLDVDQQATLKGMDEAEAALAAARAAAETAAARVEELRGAESKARLLSADTTERARRGTADRNAAARRTEELGARAAGLRAWLEAMGGGKAGGATVAAALLSTPEVEPALAAALGPLLASQPAAPGMIARDAAALLAAGARGVLAEGRGALDMAAQQSVEGQLVARGMPREAIVGWGDRLARVDAPDTVATTLRGALSAVLVLRDLETVWQAHALLARLPKSTACLVVLATPGGEALTPSGLLHRPAGDGAAALARARELREVEATAREAAEALREVEATARETEQMHQQRAAAAEAALRALRAAEHDRNARRSDVTAAERTAAQARRERDWAAERLRRAASATEARTARRRDWQGRLAATCGDLTALTQEETPAAARHEAARSAVQEAAKRRAEHGASLALIAERAADAARGRRASEETLARLDGELGARRTALAELEEEARRLGAAEQNLSARVGEAEGRIRVVRERLRPIEAELTALEERALMLEKSLAAARPEETHAAAAHQAAALAQQRAEHEVESVMAALLADLALDPADLPPAAAPQPGLQSRVKALRGRLAAFGPVNARAPDDLAAAAERQEFLQTQAIDLRDGMTRLRALIAEANATVRERFSAVTAELDAQFRLYLERLFDGGHGELTALYDEAGQPSGLEITAQPPGKKTRELSLLSGGERALVGLALIFAMLSVRPVPFCVLDEAEAALDEANTLRVGEIIRSLSARTQFIVITHNRGTMSHADALYGVTMADTGISQVAGLRLDDVEAVRRSRAG